MGVNFEIHPMVNAYELHVAGTLIPIEIPIVEIGGAPQMRGSGGCDSGFGQVLLRCLSKYVLWRVQPPIWLGAIEMPIKVLNCTPARTMYSCEYFKPLSNVRQRPDRRTASELPPPASNSSSPPRSLTAAIPGAVVS